jgi:glycosyltransferase involved in cell wall biosynthesis
MPRPIHGCGPHRLHHLQLSALGAQLHHTLSHRASRNIFESSVGGPSSHPTHLPPRAARPRAARSLAARACSDLASTRIRAAPKLTPPHASKRPQRILAWGTYDLGKPRVRILLRGLRENGVAVIECHHPVWAGVEDKSQVKDVRARMRLALRWLLAYPRLLWCYLRAPGHDAVLFPYLGQLDILILWPLAKLRRRPLILDAFLSLYNTVVEDRQLIGRRNPLAWALYGWEWLACHAADWILVDTHAHGAYFQHAYGIDAKRIHRVLVGVEPERFPPAPQPNPDRRTPDRRDRAGDGAEPFRVLFYGQFIPLHGIDTVVRAAKLTEGEHVHWHLIGTGQEAPRIERLLADIQPNNLTWTRWVPYPELVQQIHTADVCLGIFGATDKATRVIPNKVFQILAAGRPLITRDSPAARELAPAPRTTLIPAADPTALAATVCARRDGPGTESTNASTTPDSTMADISPAAVVRPLVGLLDLAGS